MKSNNGTRGLQTHLRTWQALGAYLLLHSDRVSSYKRASPGFKFSQ